MRVAILADIHGNLPACEAVLEDIARMAPDYIVAAGDLALARRPPPRDGGAALRPLPRAADGQHRLLPRRQLPGRRLPRARPLEDGPAALDARPAGRRAQLKKLGDLPFSVRYSPRKGQDLFVCHANPQEPRGVARPHAGRAVRAPLLHAPGRGRVRLRAPALPLPPARGPDAHRRRGLGGHSARRRPPPRLRLFTYTPKGWRVQIRRVRYPVRKATQALTARKVPGGRC